MTTSPEIHALVAEFATEEALAHACRRARDAGYRRIDAFSPVPSEDLAKSLGLTSHAVLRSALACGLLGAALAFGLQWFSSVYHYPFAVGGKPLYSWPPFLPVTFAFGLLSTVLGAVLGMLVANRLPRYHHPVFDVQNFTAASRDRYFLAIEATDEAFDADGTRRFLERLQPTHIVQAPA
jgi:hypothetical protein